MATVEEIIIDLETKGFKEAEKEFGQVEKAAEKATKSTEEFSNGMLDAAGDVEFMGVSLNGLKGGFNNAVKTMGGVIKSLKTLRGALISTGIGALVVALGALALWLSKTQAGMDLMNKAMAVVQGTIDGLVKSLQTLWTGFKNIANLLRSGEFTAAWDSYVDTMGEVVTNVTDATKASLDLADATKFLALAVAEGNLQIAQNNILLARAKRAGDDVTLSFDERIEATKRGIDIQNESLALQLKNLDEEIRIAKVKANNDQELTDAEIIQIKELEAARAEAIATQEEQQIELANKLNGLYLEQQAVNAERLETERVEATDRFAFQIEQEQKFTDEQQAEYKKQLNNYNKLQQDKQKQSDEALANQKKNDDLAFQSSVSLIGASAALLEAFGEDARGLAVTEALINTARGIMQIWSDPTLFFPTKVIAAASVAVTGAAQVANILKAEDGMLVGPSHKQGGILIEAEGGEAIINKRSMAIPWVREQASYLNQIGGGVPLYANGGTIPSEVDTRFDMLGDALSQAQTVLVLEDLQTVESASNRTNVTTTLA